MGNQASYPFPTSPGGGRRDASRRVIGVAVNGRAFTDEQLAGECEEVARRVGLPACDVYRYGPEKLVEAVMKIEDWEYQ